MPDYASDLASIHHQAFTDHARLAGMRVVEELRKRTIADGVVVELGCGSGVSSKILTDPGYAVWGVGPSRAMVELARAYEPKARFEVGSAWEVAIPSAVAVMAVGEVLSYRRDSAHRESFIPLLARISEALAPGGLFIADFATVERSAGGTHRHVEADDWALLLDYDNDGEMLTRRISIFKRDGGSTDYRRSLEVHFLELYETDQISKALEEVGFQVQVFDRYTENDPFPSGLVGFLAVKAD